MLILAVQRGLADEKKGKYKNCLHMRMANKVETCSN
jgi:hypothetical protein